MANRKTEVALVARMLESEAEDVEALAAAVIDALDQDRRKRDNYAIRVTVAGETFGVGPYPTKGAAEKVAVALRPDLDPALVKQSVYRLIRPAIMEDDLAPKLAHWCVECHHPMATHDWPKSKIPGCVITGCTCGQVLQAAA